jgi:hypothetical protein
MSNPSFFLDLFVSFYFTAISSEFELNTTMAAPVTANNTPKRSRFLNTSFNMSGARITLETNVVVPSGAMVEAGAKP